MYVLQYVLVRESGVVRELDLSNDILGKVLEEWDVVDLVVKNPTLEGLLYMRASDHVILKKSQARIGDFVRSPVFTTYPIKEFDEFESNKKVVVSNFWKRGFKVTEGKHGTHPSNLKEEDSKPDLLLTGGYINYDIAAKNNLVSINGLIHPVSASEEGLYVLGGMENAAASSAFQAQLIDFTELGGIEFHPINDATRVYPHNVADVSEQGMYIRIPDSWREKTIGVVVLGHLHLLDRTYNFFESDVIHISLKDMDIPRKIIRHHQQLGLCNVDKYIRGELGRIDMLSDSLLEHSLSHKNTFLFAIDQKEVLRRERAYELQAFPGLAFGQRQCKNLMMHYSGKVVEYLESYQNGVWVYRVVPEQSTKLIMQTTDYAKSQMGCRGLDTNQGYTWSTPMSVDFFATETA